MRKQSDNISGFNPLEDPHFADTVQDLLTIYKPSELEQEPYVQTYVIELLARWGRWHSRGRAPALCFEAACVGGQSFLKKANRMSNELTGRADAALARLLAGLVIDEVEPMARQQGGAVRQKAVAIVADEFLSRAVSPKVAIGAKKRIKKRRTLERVIDYSKKEGSLNKRIPSGGKNPTAKYQKEDKILQPSRSPPLRRVDDTAFIGKIPHNKIYIERDLSAQFDQRQRKIFDDTYFQSQNQNHEYSYDRIRKLSVEDESSKPYNNQYFDQNDRPRIYYGDQTQQYDNDFQMYNEQPRSRKASADHQYNEPIYHDRHRKMSADSVSSRYPYPEVKARQDSLPDPRDIHDFMSARGSVDRSNVERMAGNTRSKTTGQQYPRQDQELQPISTRFNQEFHPISTRQQELHPRPIYPDVQSPHHQEPSRYQEFPVSPRDQRTNFDRPDRQQPQKPQIRNQPTRSNAIVLPKANFDEYGTPLLDEAGFRSRDIRQASKTPTYYDRPRTPNIDRIKTPNVDRSEGSKSPTFERTTTPTQERSERSIAEERKRKGSKGDIIGNLMRNAFGKSSGKK